MGFLKATALRETLGTTRTPLKPRGGLGGTQPSRGQLTPRRPELSSGNEGVTPKKRLQDQTEEERVTPAGTPEISH